MNEMVFLDARQLLALALHVVLASAVTVHALLRKADVGSATGWIGLAWLSPIVGAALYALLGVNRVRRRAQEMRAAPVQREEVDGGVEILCEKHLAPLDRAAGDMTGRPSVGGNRIKTLCNGDEAYPLMLAAIDAATSSIALSSYILRDDLAGGPFLDALIRAHGRGVQVRVLIDGIGGGYFTSWAYRRLGAPWRSRRPIHAFDAALAHALHQFAHAQKTARH